MSAGALLGVAGLILQRLTNNEMASPEVLGVSAGAILAVAVSLFAFGSLGKVNQSISATIGGLAVLAAILALGRRSGFAPERVLLAGIALNALIDAVVGVLSATGDPRAIMLLGLDGRLDERRHHDRCPAGGTRRRGPDRRKPSGRPLARDPAARRTAGAWRSVSRWRARAFFFCCWPL